MKSSWRKMLVALSFSLSVAAQYGEDKNNYLNNFEGFYLSEEKGDSGHN